MALGRVPVGEGVVCVVQAVVVVIPRAQDRSHRRPQRNVPRLCQQRCIAGLKLVWIGAAGGAAANLDGKVGQEKAQRPPQRAVGRQVVRVDRVARPDEGVRLSVGDE
eukprot:scaffold35327_cov90-Isochrysis_galbana.AAC.2